MSSFTKVQTDIWPIFESVTVKLGEIRVTLAVIFWLLTAKLRDTFANCPEKKNNKIIMLQKHVLQAGITV